MARCFAACCAGQIPLNVPQAALGCRLSHPAEKIYRSYCHWVQILTILETDFVGWMATFGSAEPDMPHDLNIYPQCAGWRFMAHCHEKPQSFETPS